MSMYWILAALITFWCGCQETHAAPGDCSSKCVGKPIMHEKAVCDKKTAKKKFSFTYYDTKLDKCIISYCIKNHWDVFDEVEECTAACPDCPRFLKHFKQEVDCLKNVNIDTTNNTQGSPVAQNPTYLWSFDKDSGKCTQMNIVEKLPDILNKSWRLTEGVGLPSQSECEKKCPSMN